MITLRKTTQPKLYLFTSFFLSLMFFLPFSVGGFLVYFSIISESLMWIASLLVSAFFATYWAMQE